MRATVIVIYFVLGEEGAFLDTIPIAMAIFRLSANGSPNLDEILLMSTGLLCCHRMLSMTSARTI